MTHPLENNVDLVFTWIQPDDISCFLERNMHQVLQITTKATDTVINNSRRFPAMEVDHTRTELYYSILLAYKHLPWIRNIYIVLHDNQTFRHNYPPELASKIHFVYHSQIFPNPLVELPTFNSHAIECCLHNIPGLSEHFIYLNDDVYILESIKSPSFFYFKTNAIFTNKQQYLPYYFSDSFTKRKFLDEQLPMQYAIHYICSVRNHKLFDYMFGFQSMRHKPWHQPLVLTKSLCQQAETVFPIHWKETRESKFRSISNIVPIYLALGLAHVQKQIPLAPWKVGNISLWRSCPANFLEWKALLRLLSFRKKNKQILFLCLNDMCDSTPLDVRNAVFDFLRKKCSF